jgi:putative transposase
MFALFELAMLTSSVYLMENGMPNYRRIKLDGGTYFFTINLFNRKTDLLIQHIDTLRQSFKQVRLSYPFKINALVVLPDHIHMVITLPKNDNDFSTRIRLLKRHFSKNITVSDTEQTESRVKRQEKSIWQRRFWEHHIRDDNDYNNHINYCYLNPVKHGLATHVKDWPYSTFHRDVTTGLFQEDWFTDVKYDTEFGE